MKEQILAVQRMQDYIEESLDSEITLAGLAKVSLFSPWYSYRIFKEYTSLTPADYVRRLRLSRSAMRLKSGGCHITDAAFELGFGSVDGYIRAFSREFGTTPGEYAKNPVPIALFVPYGAKFRALRKDRADMSSIKNVFIQIIRKPVRKVIIKRGVKAAEYLMFQGEPFAEEDYCEAIFAVQQAAERYQPAVIGYRRDAENPRIQLEPRGERGYIEL